VWNYILVQEATAMIESLGIRWIEVNSSREVCQRPVPQLEFSVGSSSTEVRVSVAVVNTQQLIKVLYC